MSYLDFAELRHRADRNYSRLVAGDQHQCGFDRGAHLKNGAVARCKTEIKQCGGELIGVVVEFGEGNRALFADKDWSLGMELGASPQRTCKRVIVPGARPQVRLGFGGVTIDNAIDWIVDPGQSPTSHRASGLNFSLGTYRAAIAARCGRLRTGRAPRRPKAPCRDDRRARAHDVYLPNRLIRRCCRRLSGSRLDRRYIPRGGSVA